MTKYFTKDGKEISFKWHEYDPKQRENPDDRGWIVHRLDAFVDGDQVGYLSISYIPSSQAQKLYKDVWGWLYNYKEYSGDGKNTRNKDQRFKDFYWHHYSHIDWGFGNYIGKLLKNLPNMTPSEYEEYKKIRDTSLKEIADSNQRRYKKFVKFHVDRPLVDFIRVNPEFQRRGVALALYEEGSRILAKRGLRLFASGIQSNEAKSAWKAMKSRGKLPIKQFGKRTVLDFTKKAFYSSL